MVLERIHGPKHASRVYALGLGARTCVSLVARGHRRQSASSHCSPRPTTTTLHAFRRVICIMRRAQTVRNYGRPSIATGGVDDLGMLKEDESVEDVLRRQLLEKDRECDRVCMCASCAIERPNSQRLQLQIQIQSLQAQLAQRPALDKVQALEKEYTNLELILQGTQRENERCMAELERCVSGFPFRGRSTSANYRA